MDETIAKFIAAIFRPRISSARQDATADAVMRRTGWRSPAGTARRWRQAKRSMKLRAGGAYRGRDRDDVRAAARKWLFDKKRAVTGFLECGRSSVTQHAKTIEPSRASTVQTIRTPGGIDVWLVVDYAPPLRGGSVSCLPRRRIAGPRNGQTRVATMLAGLLDEGWLATAFIPRRRTIEGAPALRPIATISADISRR